MDGLQEDVTNRPVYHYHKGLMTKQTFVLIRSLVAAPIHHLG